MDIISQLVANSIIAGAIYSLVALGFNLIYGSTKFFNLTHGVIAAVGGYTVFALYKEHSVNLYLSIAVALIVTGLVGWLLERFVYYPLRNRKASQMVMLVASLGAFTAIQAIIAMIFSSQFQTLSNGGADVQTYTIFGGIYTQVHLIMIASVVLIMVVLGLIIKFTNLGKEIRAISDSEEVSKIVGINTKKVVGIVMIIGSLLAGYAGVLVGFDTGIEPTMGMGLLLKGVIASIIGGVGNVYGGVVGAFFLGFVENFGIWKISGEWKDAIAFIVLIIFLLVRPQGIMKK